MAQIVHGLAFMVVGQADNRVWRCRSAETVARDKEACDRAADQTCDDQPKSRRRNADFERIRDAEALGDDRRPGDRGAVATNERGGTYERRDPLGQTERGDAPGRNQILDHQIDQRQAQQDKERTAAGDEVVEPRVETDAGEEIEEQHVTRVEREADLNAQHKISQQGRQSRDETARHRFGNVPAPQRRDETIEPRAGEEHENGNREGKQSRRVNGRHREVAVAPIIRNKRRLHTSACDANRLRPRRSER